MAKERRDSKNRLLGKGEYQKEDGRYMYRYTDINGKPRYVYSWTLTKSDRLPKGKTPGPCLRDLEAQIAKDIGNGIDTFTASKATVDEYFEKFISQKRNLKRTTRHSYRYKYNLYLKDRIGHRPISSVKFSEVQKVYNDILEQHGVSGATMITVNAVMKQTFNLAVRDNLLRTNPVEGVLLDVLNPEDRKHDKKFALTTEQQNEFFKFVEKSNVYQKWMNLYVVLLGTGCRIGEVCGLTWNDCDFENKVIHINRTLCYYPEELTGKYRWIIQTPKTDSGRRSIPMLDDVEAALRKEKAKRLTNGFCETVVDGVSGFVFCTRNLTPVMPNEANKTLTRIVRAYNKKEAQRAESEQREYRPLPDFSPHILRHTFCTRLCELGVDVKVVQEVMGHADLSVTMNVYNNITMDYKKSMLKKADELFKIG